MHLGPACGVHVGRMRGECGQHLTACEQHAMCMESESETAIKGVSPLQQYATYTAWQ